MKLLVLLIIFLLSPYFTLTSLIASTQPEEKNSLISEIEPIIPLPINPDEFRSWLRQQNTALNPLVIEKVIMTITCAQQHHVQHNNILTIIDYSLPSSEKRLWVFDLKQKKFLFHTYVSHGLMSGASLPKFFSNKFDSKASSLGV